MAENDLSMLAAAAVLLNKPSLKVKIIRRHHMRPSLKAREIYSAEDLLRDLIRDDTHPITKEVTINGYFKGFVTILYTNSNAWSQ